MNTKQKRVYNILKTTDIISDIEEGDVILTKEYGRLRVRQIVYYAGNSWDCEYYCLDMDNRYCAYWIHPRDIKEVYKR